MEASNYWFVFMVLSCDIYHITSCFFHTSAETCWGSLKHAAVQSGRWSKPFSVFFTPLSVFVCPYSALNLIFSPSCILFFYLYYHSTDLELTLKVWLELARCPITWIFGGFQFPILKQLNPENMISPLTSESLNRNLIITLLHIKHFSSFFPGPFDEDFFTRHTVTEFQVFQDSWESW